MNKDNIKSYEDACAALGLDPSAMPDVTKVPAKDAESIIANFKLIIIARALNNGWEPNWQDRQERKWSPWFEAHEDRPGFGFSSSHCDCWYSYSSCGSRLCFQTEELSDYAGRQFEELYNQLFLIK